MEKGKKAVRPIPEGIQIAPSLLSANFARLAEEIQVVEAAGARMLHLDVMDGHFVPNITFGPPLVASVRRATDLFLDVHLMIEDPLGFLPAFLDAGPDLVSLHAEALLARAGSVEEALRALGEAAGVVHSSGAGFGIVFKPGTDPAPWIERAGPWLDLVLVMTVEPGFGGQAMIPAQVEVIGRVATLREQARGTYRIEVDGGVTAKTAARCVEAGAEILVAGAAVFGQQDRRSAMRALLEAAEGAARS